MRSRWLAYRPNTLILILLIQQPEPSGSEAGESRVRNRVREILPTKHIITLCRVLLYAVNLRHGSGGKAEKIKYTFKSRHHATGQNFCVKAANKYFEKVTSNILVRL
jgi:hypothetical protein